MKKKVNVFGKSVPVFVIAIFAMVLVSAALVPYLSNTITGLVTVESPIELTISAASAGVVITHDPEKYTVSLFGGQDYFIETTLTNNVDGLTGHIAESVIFNFDGEGITVVYTDNLLQSLPTPLSFEIAGCQDGGNTYYYIGDPNNPLVDLVSTTTVTTDLNLEPRTYNAETRVILESGRKCTAP